MFFSKSIAIYEYLYGEGRVCFTARQKYEKCVYINYERMASCFIIYHIWYTVVKVCGWN